MKLASRTQKINALSVAACPAGDFNQGEVPLSDSKQLGFKQFKPLQPGGNPPVRWTEEIRLDEQSAAAFPCFRSDFRFNDGKSEYAAWLQPRSDFTDNEIIERADGAKHTDTVNQIKALRPEFYLEEIALDQSNRAIGADDGSLSLLKHGPRSVNPNEAGVGRKAVEISTCTATEIENRNVAVERVGDCTDKSKLTIRTAGRLIADIGFAVSRCLIGGIFGARRLSNQIVKLPITVQAHKRLLYSLASTLSIVLLLSTPLWAAVAVDGTCTLGADDSTTPYDVTHTVGASATYLTAFVVGSDGADNFGATATWDPAGANQSMGSLAASSLVPYRGAAYGLANPTAGTLTLRVTSAPGNIASRVFVCSWTGVDPAAPTGTIGETESINPDTGDSLAFTLNAGGLAVSFIGLDSDPTGFAQGADQTELLAYTTFATIRRMTAATATVSPLDYTWTSSSADYWHVVIPLNAVATAKPRPPIIIQ